MFIFVFILFILKTLVYCQICHSNININDTNCFNEVLYFNQENRNYRAGHFAMNTKGDMIVEYSYLQYRLFYGLKKDGKNYFPNGTKEIEITSNTINADSIQRYESNNLFISFVNDTYKQKEYLLSVSTFKSVVEIHDLENDIYNITEAIEFFNNQNGIYSYVFQVLETKIDNEIIYFFIYM